MGKVKGKTTLMIYFDHDMREWIRQMAFRERTTMSAIVVDAMRAKIGLEQQETEATRGINAKRRRKTTTAKTAE